MAHFDAYLSTVFPRLEQEKYIRLESPAVAAGNFEAVALRSGWEWSKFGFSEVFFVFGRIEDPTEVNLRAFSARAMEFALNNRKIRLPRGFFESVWCFSVALTTSLADVDAQKIREVSPPKHWAAAEIPVVFDEAQQRIVYFERTPLWGAAYYAGIRKDIQRLLTPAAN